MTGGKSAFVSFNRDNTKAEIFLSTKNEGIVLTKTNEGNWSNSEYTLISWKGYVLQQNEKPIFGGQ